MNITTIFFDLGSTLIYAKDPWSPIFRQADLALVKVLRIAEKGMYNSVFDEEFGAFIETYYSNNQDDTIEHTSFSILREMLARKGLRHLPDPVLHTALDAMYAIIQSNWYAEEDAISTLDALKVQGYRLGMISNTSDDKNVQSLVDKCGFRHYFEFIVTSAAFGFRKPDQRIFQAALDHFLVAPECVAMVGDTLSADIEGANRLDIYSIWITRRAASGTGPAIVPRAIVKTLSELPVLLKSIS